MTGENPTLAERWSPNVSQLKRWLADERHLRELAEAEAVRLRALLRDAVLIVVALTDAERRDRGFIEDFLARAREAP